MMNLKVLYIFLVLSGYCFCQNTIIISSESYILPDDPVAEAKLQLSFADTLEITWLNFKDSWHLLKNQSFDSLSVYYLSEYDLEIDKNDSIINQIFLRHRASKSFKHLIRVKPNVYDVFFNEEQHREFQTRIEISENSICYYDPIYYSYYDDSTQRKKEFDSLNYDYSKFCFNNGFVTCYERRVVMNGILSNFHGEIAEYEYVFFENEIHLRVKRKRRENLLNLIRIYSTEGLYVISKFNLLNYIYAYPYFFGYEVYHPVLLFHFPELLEKLR
jgi:hypothetical protein